MTSEPNTRPSRAPTYGADDIQVLEGLEAVRKRPGMYIGSTGPRGLHHLVYEIVDNSVDEALAGYCDNIDVTILADGGVRVDRQRPRHPRRHPPGREASRRSRSCSRSCTPAASSAAAGTRSPAVCTASAAPSSTRSPAALDVEVRRQGHVWRQSYTTACPTRRSRRARHRDETGTTITFWPSADIFETVEFDYETLRARFQQMAFLNKGLRITLTDERAASRARRRRDEARARAHDAFLYERGLVDYVEYLNRAKKADLVNDEIISFESEDTERKIALEVAMQWTTAYTESVHTYANTINTHEGGTHEEGFRAALTTLVNKYAREKGILKEKDENLSGDDVREGLTAVISIKLAEPQFEGQTKTKLGNTEAKAFVQRVVGDQLGDWFDRNPDPGHATSSARRSRRRPPASPPARRASRPAARACSRAAACPASSRTASRRTRRSPRSSSSRATRPAAPPCRAATPRPRRSCRCAARSSTSRRRGSTARSATTRCRR